VIRARQLAGASIGLGTVTIWGALLGLVTTPYLIHRLGVSSYGVFALITIISGYLLNLEFGFGQATVRFLARARGADDREAEAAVLGSSLAVFVPAAVVAGSLVLFGAPFIVHNFAHGPPSLHATFVDAIRLGGPIVAVSFISSFASSSLQALGRFDVVIRTRAIFGTLASITAVGAAAAGGGLRGVLAAQLGVATGLCVVLFRALAQSTSARLRPRLHRSTFRAMAVFGFFVLLSGLGTQLMLQGAPTVLAADSTTAQVAAFAVPSLVLQQLLGLVGATSLGFFPFVSAASAGVDRAHVGAMYRANLRMTLLVMGPVAAYLAIFAHTLLATWIDPRFAATASAPLRLLTGAIVVLGLSAPPSDAARGFGRPALVTLYTAASAVAVLGLAFAVVPTHGAAGAAFALSLGLALTTLPFMFLIAKALLDVRAVALTRALSRPVVALVGVASVFALGAAISSGFVMAILAGAIGTLVYAGLAFHFVLDEREREVFRSLLKQLGPILLRLQHRSLRAISSRNPR